MKLLNTGCDFILDEISIIQNFGVIGGLSIIVIITGKWMLTKTFEQLEKANASITENNKDAREFLQEHIKKNTEILTEIKTCIENNSNMILKHVESKDIALEAMREQQKTINDLFGRINQPYNRNDSL